MEDFEHSEHDWDCFIWGGEERNPLPPSLARVDDSGMSNLGDIRCTDMAWHIDQTPGFMEADHPVDSGPPDCEGPPVEYPRRKHSVGGMENVLSGSEEDIHLESVNTFFERHRRLAGPEQLTGLSQERLQEQGEIILDKDPWSDGPRASNNDLPKTVAVLNSLPARSETALGTDATQTAKGNININTMNKDGADSEATPERADGSSRVETNKLTNPETELLTGEDWLMTTATHKLRQHSRYWGPSHDFICLENTVGSDRALSSEMCKRSHDAEYGQPSLNMETLCRVVGVAVEEKLQKVNINLLLPGLDPNSLNRNAGKERPQSDYSRTKRKKKKIFSSLLEKSGHRGQFSTESEQQQSVLGSGMDPCLSKNHSEVCVSEKHISDCVFAGSPPSTDVIQTSSFIENPSDHIHPFTQHRHVPDNLDNLASSSVSISNPQCNTLPCPPANTSSHKSFSTRGQADDSLAPTPADGSNVATHLQAHGPSQQNESTGSTLTPGSLTLASICERSFLSGDERDADRVGILQQLYEMKHSLANSSCKSERKSHFHAAEVNSITNSISQSGDSNEPIREDNQNDEEANREESHLAAEKGFSGRDNPTECPRDAQHSQKLGIDNDRTAQLSSSDLPRSTIVMIGSDTQELTQELKTGVFVENPVDVTSGHLNLDFSKVSPDAESTTLNPQHVIAIPKLSVFSGNTSTERIQSPLPHITTVHSCDTSSFQSEEISSNSTNSLEGSLNNRSIMTTDTLKLTQSYGGLCSTEPSKYEGDIADMSDNTPQVVATGKRDKAVNEVERQEALQDTLELKCPIEEPDTKSETGEDVSNAPDSKNKVFAMSSFWDEMERLTIKDILGLRMTSTTPPPRSRSPLMEIDNNDTADTGYVTPHIDDTKTVSTVPGLEQANVNNASSVRDASFSSLDVTWEGEPKPVSLGAGIYPENMMLTSDTDNPQALLSTSGEERRHRRMLKNASVHNLHALDSEQFSRMWKVQTSAAVIPEESESERECFSDVQKPCCDCGADSIPSSLFTEGTPIESYRISLTDIFQFLFGGKQSNPKPPDSEDTDTSYSHGNAVPETYDQFFSEFDSGSFFYPLIAKDKSMPIFSHSRSSSRYLQFPEAYDHFLSSSSSDDDDSSTESEEDDLGPIRVVTRFSHRTTEAQTSTDIYENFFTDWDVRQNLFWNPTFSLRNVRLTGTVSQKQQSSGPLTPVERSSVQRRRCIFPSINALGNQDTGVPDPLLYHFEERVYRQLSTHPFSFDDLQSAVSNPSEPSLGASLVPLRQSDMCLVCIAFASWVLKSANPHVGDAWKAVLLANVSALSAIRYLRKYMSERSLDHPAISRPTLGSPVGEVNL